MSNCFIHQICLSGIFGGETDAAINKLLCSPLQVLPDGSPYALNSRHLRWYCSSWAALFFTWIAAPTFTVALNPTCLPCSSYLL